MIRLENVSKTYGAGKQEVHALRGVDLRIEGREFVSIMGPSGSGKSTLLNLIGALDTPSRGEIWLEGTAVSRMDDDALTRFRRDRLGLIFQFFNLLPMLSAQENVALPLLLAGRRFSEVQPRARELLDLVGLSHRTAHKPDELSGGEMQRVAIARALMADPALLLADEPTGNLDSKSGREILQLLRHLSRERGYTIVMVTHDAQAAHYGDRIVELCDGRIVAERRVEADDPESAPFR